MVYLGTDTHLHCKLDDGTPFTVRQQNARGQGLAFEAGSRTRVLLATDAAQVLKD